jgi:hypothetical protein
MQRYKKLFDKFIFLFENFVIHLSSNIKIMIKKLIDKFDKWCEEEININFNHYWLTTNQYTLLIIVLIILLIYCITQTK